MGALIEFNRSEASRWHWDCNVINDITSRTYFGLSTVCPKGYCTQIHACQCNNTNNLRQMALVKHWWWCASIVTDQSLHYITGINTNYITGGNVGEVMVYTNSLYASIFHPKGDVIFAKLKFMKPSIRNDGVESPYHRRNKNVMCQDFIDFQPSFGNIYNNAAHTSWADPRHHWLQQTNFTLYCFAVFVRACCDVLFWHDTQRRIGPSLLFCK